MMYFNLLLIIMIVGVISLFHVPRLLQPKQRGELIACLSFLLIGMALAAALTLRLPVPNPTSGIEFVFRPIVTLVYPQ
jgi:hypothetical protein